VGQEPNQAFPLSFHSSLKIAFHGFRVTPDGGPVLPKKIDAWLLTSLEPRWVKTGGRRIKPARHSWFLVAESPLTRRLFGAVVRRIEAPPVQTGQTTLRRERNPSTGKEGRGQRLRDSRCGSHGPVPNRWTQATGE